MYRVLIVDDEMPALRFVQSIIERFATNFQVAGVATSGEQGFQLLEQQMFDLLITDIGMRGMNGIELAQTARAMQPNIRIVIISGYGKFEYAQGAIQAGVDDYLLKPVSISKMTAILENLEKKLDASQSDLNATLLPAIACKQPYSQESPRPANAVAQLDKFALDKKVLYAWISSVEIIYGKSLFVGARPGPSM